MKIWREKNPKTGKFEWHADFRADKRRYYPVAASRDELDEIIEVIKKRARARKHGLEIERVVVTIAELVSARKKDYDAQKSGHRRYLSIIESFRDYLDDDQFAVEHIKTAHVRGFVQSLRAKNPKLQASTVNNYLGAICALLHSGERHFPALENWKPPRMPLESMPLTGRERVITEEEQARLFFELRAPAHITGTKHPQIERELTVRSRHTVADLFDFALLTGIRNTEARSLSRPQIDWTRRTVRDPRSKQEVTSYGEVTIKGKGGKTRRVPLNSDARQLLERRIAESDSQFVFSNVAGTRPLNQTIMYRILRRAAARAGVPYGRDLENGFVFHDARHTAATNMLQRGSDVKTVGTILGHSDKTTTMRYVHATPHSKTHAVGSLEREPKTGNQEGDG